MVIFKGIFTEEYNCEITLEELEIFYQILLPLYKFSILVQKTNASIMVVYPSILLILNSSLPKLNLDGEYNIFRNQLIATITSKFKLEMESDMYLVAAVLNTSSLHLWYNAEFGKIHFKNGINKLTALFISLFAKSSENKNTEVSSAISSNHSSQAKSDDDMDLFNSLVDVEKVASNIDKTNVVSFQLSLEIDKEVKEFTLILTETSFKKLCTRQFWIKYQLRMPNLYKLFLYFMTISASSAIIERYFSICGVVCKQRSSNISEETIITRSMLKVNMSHLEDLFN